MIKVRKTHRQSSLLDWIKHAELAESGVMEAHCNDCHTLTERYTVIDGNTYHLNIDECIEKNKTLIPLLVRK